MTKIIAAIFCCVGLLLAGSLQDACQECFGNSEPEPVEAHCIACRSVREFAISGDVPELSVVVASRPVPAKDVPAKVQPLTDSIYPRLLYCVFRE